MLFSTTGRVGDWMQCASGQAFFPLDPRADEIHLEDIAHSLSLQCRYAGHVKHFFSVAQHSVLVSLNVPAENAAWGLLHDATEAYLVDLPRPIKRSSCLGDEYVQIENRLMRVIGNRFGLAPEEPESVLLADKVLLMTEARDLMGPPPVPWFQWAEPLKEIIVPWTAVYAKERFLARAEELGVR